MRAVAVALAFALPLAFVGKAWAADTCPTTKPQHQEGHFLMMGPWNVLKDLNLTDEQKAKLKDLRKEFEPKFKATVDSVLTPDQKKARDEAMKTSKKGGLFTTTLKLTDEQKTKLRESLTPVEKELHAKTAAILTPEQEKQLEAKMAEHRAKVEKEKAATK